MPYHMFTHSIKYQIIEDNGHINTPKPKKRPEKDVEFCGIIALFRNIKSQHMKAKSVM